MRPSGEGRGLEQLVESLREFDVNRDQLPQMKKAARKRAEEFTWASYRNAVKAAVSEDAGVSD